MNRTVVVVFLILSFAKYSHAALFDQTGNLIKNGDFEAGGIAPWLSNDDPTVTIISDRTVDAGHSALIDTAAGHPGHRGDWVVGLYQYPFQSGDVLPNAFYTLSAWIYPISGQAHIGLAYGGGGHQHYSEATSVLGQWQYVELTWQLIDGAGPVLFGLSNQDKFYVDGVWLSYVQNFSDLQHINPSPYAPYNGFANPNPVPEPTILVLLSIGLVGVALGRLRHFVVLS